MYYKLELTMYYRLELTMYYYCLWYDKLWGLSQRVVTLLQNKVNKTNKPWFWRHGETRGRRVKRSDVLVSVAGCFLCGTYLHHISY